MEKPAERGIPYTTAGNGKNINLMKKQLFKKILLHLIGLATLLAGVVLILTWWQQLVIVFQGAIGVILALVGLAMLYMART